MLLKLDHLGAETISKRLPSIREIAIKFANVDITKEPIPVVPTIHYQMGGIPTNIHGQVVAPQGRRPERGRQRPVRGRRVLLRVSVHGANRLGTNSLLDLLVFGRAAGNHIVDSNLAGDRRTSRCRRTPPTARWRAWRGSTARPAASTSQDVANDMRTHDAGALRRVPHPGSCWTRACARSRELARARQAHRTSRTSRKVFNTARVEALELDNLIEAAQATDGLGGGAHGKSRGAHGAQRLSRARRRQLAEAHALVHEATASSTSR